MHVLEACVRRLTSSGDREAPEWLVGIPGAEAPIHCQKSYLLVSAFVLPI